VGRPRIRPLTPGAKPGQDDRTNIIALKGSREYADWFAKLHAKTHIPKATIVRLAIAEWARRHGHPAPPAV
jgi:hypothetical protein